MIKILKYFAGFVFCIVVFLTPRNIHAFDWPTLFFDDFSDGDFNGWTVEYGNWFINGGVLVGDKLGMSFGGRINSGNSEWDNYSVELDVNSSQGIDQGIGFRYSSNSSYEVNLRYGTGMYDTPQVKLWKNNGTSWVLLTDTHSFSLINDKWYHVKINVLNENIKVWIDDSLIFDFTDPGTNIKKGVIDLEYSTGAIGIAYMKFDNVKITALSPPPTPKTPLILIPGIGGSELKVAEDTIWDEDDGHGGEFSHIYPAGEMIWVNEGEAANPGEDDYFDVLRMKIDGVTSEANLGLTGNLYAGAYQGAISFFTQNGYTLNQDFFVFPYDWRKDLSLTASLLDTKINQIKSQTGAQKVDLVAHSMGGLVARNYIADTIHAQNVRKLFALGTPHLGTPEFLKNLRYGGCLTKPELQNLPYCIGLTNSEVKDVLQNMISGFQLAPSQLYFNFYSNEDNLHPYPYRTESGTLDYDQIKNILTILGHNTLLFNPSETFHSIDSVLSNTNGVDVTIVSGSGIPTLGQIIELTFTTLNGNKITYKDKLDINGDGTVALLSSSITDPHKGLFFNGPAKVYYTNQEHGSLVFNGSSLNLVKNILANDNDLPDGVSTTPYKMTGHGLSVHSPVTIHVYDSSGNHTGPTPDGDFEVNIPGSSYDTLGNAKFIYLPDEGIYTIRFEATDQGSFDFKIRKFEDDENTETILYKEIPLTYNTSAETTFDTNSDQTPIINVDKDGNGSFDFGIEHFSILEGETNYDYTPPTISFDVNPKIIWPPNGKMVDVNIVGTITDENPYLTTILVDDEYDLVEPPVTTYDQTGINQTIELEASRYEEDKNGRTYTIRLLVTDLAGNTSLSTFEVIVPHDQRDKK